MQVISEKYDTLWKRIGAGFIDGIVLTPLSFLSVWINGMEGPAVALALLIIVSRCGPWIYNVLMHGYCGQTVGKKVAGITVLDISERPISMWQAFLRESFYVGVNVIAVTLYIKRRLGTVHDPDAILRVQAFIGLSALIWFVLEIVSTLLNGKRRALHDLIAGTVVVRSNYVSKPDPLQKLIEEIRSETAQTQDAPKKADVKTAAVGR